MQKGTIGVTTENIFPVIKKFLYSDHEIFLRELVSNAVDASQKIRTLANFGDFKGELGTLDVRVTIDKEAGTLTVSDHGIGMDAEDVDKYINQIAFSGAEDFLNKYKDNAANIIGHFGLGFYSAFMVAEKVVINSLSYKEGAKPVRWSCDGSPEYSMEEGDRTERGTDIILYIDKDSAEFLDQQRVDLLLRKYCRFLPVPVISGKEREWKDGNWVDTDRDLVVNATEPQWMKKPSELTDDDYRRFYQELYPGEEDPLFWIHLNVDYPFTLTGILYFPKIKNNFDINRNRIQLYCNQVYVTDSVEGVVPEFMQLMQGVIDSPDIPLNVSRIFIVYGMLTDEKFCDAALKFLLLRDTEGQYFTTEEYKTLVEASQTDKEGKIVYLYATDAQAQYNYIKAANDKGYNVLLLDGQLDNHFVGLLEQKLKDTRLVRVDSDVIDNLIRRDDRRNTGLSAVQTAILSQLFSADTAKVDKASFTVQFEALGANAQPITLTQNEYMRRMKEMAALQPSMNFYGELPDSYSLVVNTEHPLVKDIVAKADTALLSSVEPLLQTIDSRNADAEAIRKAAPEGKTSAEEDARIADLEKEVAAARTEMADAISKYGKSEGADDVRQLVDLALLGNGLLKGQNLADFISRTVAMMQK